MTNLERQRAFCARNPHYYRDRHRRKKAERAAAARLMAEHPDLTLAQAHAIAQGKAPAPQKAEAPETPPVVLALPAPEDMVNPMVTMTLRDALTYQPAKIRIVSEPKTLDDAASADVE